MLSSEHQSVEYRPVARECFIAISPPAELNASHVLGYSRLQQEQHLRV